MPRVPSPFSATNQLWAFDKAQASVSYSVKLRWLTRSLHHSLQLWNTVLCPDRRAAHPTCTKSAARTRGAGQLCPLGWRPRPFPGSSHCSLQLALLLWSAPRPLASRPPSGSRLIQCHSDHVVSLTARPSYSVVDWDFSTSLSLWRTLCAVSAYHHLSNTEISHTSKQVPPVWSQWAEADNFHNS